jgi:hypothetical protein
MKRAKMGFACFFSVLLIDFLFTSCASTLRIKPGITEIEAGMYRDKGYESVVIPKGVTVIGNSAFSGNVYLESVTIPHGVTRIEDEAFSNCDLRSVNIPETVTYIGKNAFSNNSLASVTIPKSVTFLGEGAFSDNESLVAFVPDSLEFAKGAFGNALVITESNRKNIATFKKEVSWKNVFLSTNIGSYILATGQPTTVNANIELYWSASGYSSVSMDFQHSFQYLFKAGHSYTLRASGEFGSIPEFRVTLVFSDDTDYTSTTWVYGNKFDTYSNRISGMQLIQGPIRY